MSILDLGCGLNKQGTVGIDILKTSQTDIISDVHHLPLQDKCFNGCYALALLEHVDNPFQVLKEINRVLKKHGWLKVLVPTDSMLKSDYLARILSMDFKGLFKRRPHSARGLSLLHKWQFSETSLTHLLKHCGFSIMKINYPAMPWIYRRPASFLTQLGFTRHPSLIVEAKKVKEN